MSTTTSPNMNLIIPSVGSEAGPTYALDINSCLSLIDGHDHTPGKGVQITPAGININTDLDFSDNFASAVAGVIFQAQGSTPIENTIYQSGVDLYYVDGIGNNVRITQSGGIAGSPGSISNLTPPASASYVAGSSSFVWESDTSIAANMDFGSAIMRNLSPNSTFALTLSPPAALSSNFTLTLPTVPATSSFMTMNNIGEMATTIPTTGGISATNLGTDSVITVKIQDSAVTTPKINNNAVTPAKLAVLPLTVSAANSGVATYTGNTFINVPNLSILLTTSGLRPAVLMIYPDPAAIGVGYFATTNTAGPSAAGEIRIIRDGSIIITQTQISTSITGSSAVAISQPGIITAIDPAPTAATHTYTVEYRKTSGTDIEVVNCLLAGYEVS